MWHTQVAESIKSVAVKRLKTNLTYPIESY